MILTSGCFDGLHAGHVHYLQTARGFSGGGYYTTIALAPDAYIRAHRQREPRWPFHQRYAVLDALKGDFRIVAHEPESVASVILALKPTIFVKGEDWRGRMEPDVVAACQAVGAEIKFIESVPVRRNSEAWA